MTERNNRVDRNLYVHGFRGVLAFAVFVFHVANSGLPTFQGTIGGIINHLLLSFAHCVEIFFGISGVVIISAYARSRTAVEFLWNRVTRIFPVLWVTVLTILLLSNFDARHAIDGRVLVVVANLFALPPLVPVPMIHPAAWSIGLEFAFYIAILGGTLALRKLPRVIAVGVIAMICAALLASNIRSVGFLLGLGVASGIGHRIPSRWFRFAGIASMACLICWHVAFQTLQFDQPMRHISVLTSRPLIAFEFIAGAIFGWVGLNGVYLGQGVFARWLLTPAVQWLGTISFSLYLWSAPVMAPIKRIMTLTHATVYVGDASQLLYFALSVVPVLVISAFSQRWLERDVTRWLRRRRAPLPVDAVKASQLEIEAQESRGAA